MKLNKQTTDAIDILLYCKRAGDERVKVGEIAEELGLTKLMGLKLANRLTKAGLLHSVRGPRGGVRLTQLADELPLGQIVRRLDISLFGEEGVQSTTKLNAYFDDAFEAFLDVLDQNSLADLIKNQAAKPVSAAKSAAKATSSKGRGSKTRAVAAHTATRRAQARTHKGA